MCATPDVRRVWAETDVGAGLFASDPKIFDNAGNKEDAQAAAGEGTAACAERPRYCEDRCGPWQVNRGS